MKYDEQRPNILRLPKQVAPVKRPAIATHEGSGEAVLGVDASGNVQPAPLPMLFRPW